MVSTLGESGVVFYDISDVNDPKLLERRAFGGQNYLTSVNVTPDGKYLLVTAKDGGALTNWIGVFDMATREPIRSIELPGEPDLTAISPDGKYALTALENETSPDVPGLLARIKLTGAPSTWRVEPIEIPADPDMLYPNDPEPEYIDIAADNTAAVTLQENNAVAIVDLDAAPEAVITDIWSAGRVDRLADLTSNGRPEFTQPFSSPREPDAIAFTPDGKHLLTADEGEFTNGGRGFTIFDREGGIVYASQETWEVSLAERGLYPDDRSPSRGAEAEGADIGVYNGRTVGFIGSERGNALSAYDLTNLRAPKLLSVSRSASLEPEGVLAVPQRGLVITADAGNPRSWSIFRALEPDERTNATRQLYAPGTAFAAPTGAGADDAGRVHVLTPDLRILTTDFRTEKRGNATVSRVTALRAPDGTRLTRLGTGADVAADPQTGGWWVVDGQAATAANGGRLLRVARDGTTRVVPLAGFADSTRELFTGVATSPDGRTVYISTDENSATVARLIALDVATGAVRVVRWAPGQGVLTHDLATTPDGDLVFLDGSRSAIAGATLWRASAAQLIDGATLARTQVVSYPTFFPAFATTGGLLAVTPDGTGWLGSSSELRTTGRILTAATPAAGATGGLPAASTAHGLDMTSDPFTAAAISGDRIYLANTFGGFTRPQAGVAAFSRGIGALDTSWPEATGGRVRAVVADGAGGAYIGGGFTAVGGVARAGLAHVLADGSVDPAFNPALGGEVRALVRHGDRLWVGGAFGLVALDASGAVATTVAGNGTVTALFVDGDTLYAGGAFTTLGGEAHGHVARLNAGSGAVDHVWTPSIGGAVLDITTFAVGPRGVYVGGEFDTVNGTPRGGLVLLRTTDVGTIDTAFAPQWHYAPPRIGGLVYGNGKLYVASGNAILGNEDQERLAAMDPATGDAITSFNAGPYVLQNIVGDAVTPLVIDGGWLYALNMNHSSFARNLGRFDLETGKPDDDWTPSVPSTMNALAISGDRIIVGGSFLRAGIYRRIGAVDLKTDKVDPRFQSLQQSTAAMAASGSWIYRIDGEVARDGVRRFNAQTGAVDPDWKLDAVGAITSLVAAGDRVYVGGEFTFADGKPAGDVLALDGATGKLDPSFAPRTDGEVLGLVVDGDRIYLRGTFTRVNGQPRTQLAAVTAATGALVEGFTAPAFEGDILALEVLGGRLFVSGLFSAPRPRIAALDKLTGAFLSDWAQTVPQVPAVLRAMGGKLVIGGSNMLTAVDPISGALETGFAPVVEGNVTGLLVHGEKLIAYGFIQSVNGAPAAHYVSFTTAPPVADAPPVISGVARQGESLSCSTGTWRNGPTSFTYAWLRNGVAIDGAVGATYVVAESDLDEAITCRVVASNASGAGAASVSAPVRVGLGVPVNTVPPAVGGTAVVGRTLTCSTGTWTRGASSFAFSWLRDGTAIAGAADASYLAVAADAGHTVACRVVASSAAGASVPAVSAPVTVAAAPGGATATLEVGGYVLEGTPIETAPLKVLTKHVSAAPDTTAPAVALGARSVRSDARGRVAIQVRCPDTETACTGTVSVRVHAGKKTIALKRGTFRAAGGRVASARVSLPASLRRALKRASLQASVTISASDADGNSRAITGGVTIRR